MKIKLIIPTIQGSVDTIGTYGADIIDIAGGFTATQATGGWTDDKGRFVIEPVTVFDVSTDKDEVETVHGFIKLATRIANDLDQDCVYLEIDGAVHYIEK